MVVPPPPDESKEPSSAVTVWFAERAVHCTVSPGSMVTVAGAKVVVPLGPTSTLAVAAMAVTVAPPTASSTATHTAASLVPTGHDYEGGCASVRDRRPSWGVHGVVAKWLSVVVALVLVMGGCSAGHVS